MFNRFPQKRQDQQLADCWKVCLNNRKNISTSCNSGPRRHCPPLRRGLSARASDWILDYSPDTSQSSTSPSCISNLSAPFQTWAKGRRIWRVPFGGGKVGARSPAALIPGVSAAGREKQLAAHNHTMRGASPLPIRGGRRQRRSIR